MSISDIRDLPDGPEFEGETDLPPLNEVEALRVLMAGNKLLQLFNGLFLPDLPGVATALAHPVYEPEGGAELEGQQVEAMRNSAHDFFDRRYEAFVQEVTAAIALMPERARQHSLITHFSHEIFSLLAQALNRQEDALVTLFLDKWKTEGHVALPVTQTVFTEEEGQKLRGFIENIRKIFDRWELVESACFTELTHGMQARATELTNLAERHELLGRTRDSLERQRNGLGVASVLLMAWIAVSSVLRAADVEGQAVPATTTTTAASPTSQPASHTVEVKKNSKKVPKETISSCKGQTRFHDAGPSSYFDNTNCTEAGERKSDYAQKAVQTEWRCPEGDYFVSYPSSDSLLPPRFDGCKLKRD